MPERPLVLVHFDHGRAPAADVDFEADRDAFPYGYGACLDHLRLRASENTPEHALTRVARRGAAFLLGFDVLHAYRNRHLIDEADVVVTHTEHEHLAIALLKILKVVGNTAVVGQSIWLWDNWGRTGPLKRLLYRRLLREIAVHSTHSPVNAEFGTRVLGTTVHLVPYGAHVPRDPQAVHYEPPMQGTHVDVIAPGSDRHRDWRTLVDAARRAPDLRVTIVSRRLRARLAARRCPERVQVTAGGSFTDVQARMRSSSVVAIPLKRNMHVSGLTVLFEGLLAHRPVAMTATGGAELYGASHVDWADTDDPDSLVDAIRAAHRRSADPDGLAAGWRSVAERGLTLDDYGLRHVLAVWMALGRPVLSGLISAERPVGPLVDQEARRLESLATTDRA
jgi:hypothetical protein